MFDKCFTNTEIHCPDINKRRYQSGNQKP